MLFLEKLLKKQRCMTKNIREISDEYIYSPTSRWEQQESCKDSCGSRRFMGQDNHWRNHHCHFYEVVDKDGNFLAVFGISHWQNDGVNTECGICCLWVEEPYRRQGIFRKIVKFVKNKCSDVAHIVIGAKRTNTLANEIYDHYFGDKGKWWDEDSDGWWYVVWEKKLWK